MKEKNENDISNVVIPKHGESQEEINFYPNPICDVLEVDNELDVTPNVNFFETLRYVGYNNYTAIEDIVDNALDNDVNATNVRINIKQNTKQDGYDHIKICDDGCGMTLDTIKEAVKLGSETGKTKTRDLGCYGSGLKTAGVAIGRKFEIRTKSDDDKFYIIQFDLDELKRSNTPKIPIRIGTQREYVQFMSEIRSTTGTIITLLKLDNISNKTINVFISTLRDKLGLTFKYFIDEMDKNIFVNDEPVYSIDPMVRTEADVTCHSFNEKFQFEDHDFRFSVYNIERVSDNRDGVLRRGKPNAGLYIYRNNRMVGKALDLGILNIAGDGNCNGLRIELFVDGECDTLFGSTFTKMIQERNKNDLNQSFRDTCSEKFRPYVSSIRRTEELQRRMEKVSDEVKKEQDVIFADINKNTLIDVNKKGVNHKRETPIIKPEPSGIKRTFKGRKRTDKFAAWEVMKLGVNDVVFNPIKRNGLYVIQFNQDHPFWVNFLKDSTMEVKSMFSKFFVAQAIAVDKTTYMDDEVKELIIEQFLIQVSDQFRKLIIG